MKDIIKETIRTIHELNNCNETINICLKCFELNLMKFDEILPKIKKQITRSKEISNNFFQIIQEEDYEIRRTTQNLPE